MSASSDFAAWAEQSVSGRFTTGHPDRTFVGQVVATYPASSRAALRKQDAANFKVPKN